MAPSFAAGSITGEKERKTYEMLLASPLRPGGDRAGQAAGLAVPPGRAGVLLAADRDALPAAGGRLAVRGAGHLSWRWPPRPCAFGMISIAASSYFHRTIAALVVSYLVILPAGPGGRAGVPRLGDVHRDPHRVLGRRDPRRVPGDLGALVFPRRAGACCYPPDVGSEAQEVVDPDVEQRTAVGMVIRSEQFPDRLFAPPSASDLLPDGDQSGLRQGDAQRDLRPGHAHAPPGDPGEHGPGAAADGRVPLHVPALGRLVHQLRAAVQLAGGPGVLRRQHDQRARAANAGPAADHDPLAVADPVGQAAGPACGFPAC